MVNDLRRLRLLGVMICFGMTGCSISKPLLISSTSMGPEQEEVAGIVSGKAKQSWFLGMSLDQNVDFSFKAALENALRGKTAHTLINVFADRSCTYFPFWGACIYCSCEIRLTGTAIRYKNIGASTYSESLRPDNLQPKTGPLAQVGGERSFNDLCGTDSANAEKLYQGYDNAKKNEALQFVVGYRGKLASWGNSFVVDKNLRAEEQRCVAWFLKRFSSYVPDVESR